jgi:hypothetical protein
MGCTTARNWAMSDRTPAAPHAHPSANNEQVTMES